MVAKQVTSDYVLPNDQPIVNLDVKEAFQGLSQREQQYAHHISRASHYGGLIVLFQTSTESPVIFRLIQHMNLAAFNNYDIKQLQEFGLEKSRLASFERFKTKCYGDGEVSEEDFKAFLVYCAAIYTNMGNYKGFGDTKIVPNLSLETFETIVKVMCNWLASSNEGGEKVNEFKSYQIKCMRQLFESVKSDMYNLDDRHKQLGLGEKGGVTKYFSANCDQEDADRVNRYFKMKNMEGYINRVVKISDKNDDGMIRYEIINAASNSRYNLENTEQTFEGCQMVVKSGDYAPILDLVIQELTNALKYTGNDFETKMLEYYITSFRDGSLEAHKEGSRHWIKNKGPAVETYIGFIETYRDPVGMRGEFEGFVAMVNRTQSEKFKRLVDQAENLLTRLPWPKEFEKDKFLLPDFTSLDVLTFAGSGVPSGINIPNYDEIRQCEGFKNVNLGNVINTSMKSGDKKKTTFVSEEDHNLMDKWRVGAFEIQVGLHELLGHGSGKLLMKSSKDGSQNFESDLKNPLTDKCIDHFYDDGESYDSKFTSLGSSYEECRAEAVGLHLSTFHDVVRIFNDIESDEIVEDIMYVNWLLLCHSGIKGLEMFSDTSKQWKQAHCQARFVILQVLLEAGQGLLTVKEVTNPTDGKADLLMTLDRSKLTSVGRSAIDKFLLKLQVLKSTGDVNAAKVMYDKYSDVREDGDHPFGRWREIVMARKQPRKMLIQANTQLTNDGKVELIEYPTNDTVGMMKSWVDRFPLHEYISTLDPILDKLQAFEDVHFKY